MDIASLSGHWCFHTSLSLLYSGALVPFCTGPLFLSARLAQVLHRACLFPFRVFRLEQLHANPFAGGRLCARRTPGLCFRAGLASPLALSPSAIRRPGATRRVLLFLAVVSCTHECRSFVLLPDGRSEITHAKPSPVPSLATTPQCSVAWTLRTPSSSYTDEMTSLLLELKQELGAACRESGCDRAACASDRTTSDHQALLPVAAMPGWALGSTGGAFHLPPRHLTRNPRRAPCSLRTPSTGLLTSK